MGFDILRPQKTLSSLCLWDITYALKYASVNVWKSFSVFDGYFFNNCWKRGIGPILLSQIEKDEKGWKQSRTQKKTKAYMFSKHYWIVQLCFPWMSTRFCKRVADNFRCSSGRYWTVSLGACLRFLHFLSAWQDYYLFWWSNGLAATLFPKICLEICFRLSYELAFKLCGNKETLLISTTV